MKKSLQFAINECQIKITEEEIEIILHSCESFLFSRGEAWVKKGENGPFDIPKGSYSGAESCKLCGLYILDKLTSGPRPIFTKKQVGLYKDDGLAHIPEKGQSSRELKKQIKKVFGDVDLETVASPMLSQLLCCVMHSLHLEASQRCSKPANTVGGMEYVKVLWHSRFNAVELQE